jgi:hypothetical protein
MKPFPIKSTVGLAIAVTLSSCVYDNRPHNPSPTVAYETHVTETHRPGYVVPTLPSHQVEVIGGTRYYRQGDVYYRPHAQGYVVVESPRREVVRQGTVIRSLPSGYRTVTQRGTRYYVHNGVYYQRSGAGYVVVPGL